MPQAKPCFPATQYCFTKQISPQAFSASHDLEGKCIAGKIIIFPGGKGSSVVQADGMYKLDTAGLAPCGLIVSCLDTVLVSSAIIMEIPMVDDVDPLFYERVKEGDHIILDATGGTITIDCPESQ